MIPAGLVEAMAVVPAVSEAAGFDVPSMVGVTTPFATALAMVYLIFTGKLYVKSAHDGIVRVLENQLAAVSADREVWRTSSLAKDGVIATLTSTNAKFLESARFQDHVMAALQETTGGHKS